MRLTKAHARFLLPKIYKALDLLAKDSAEAHRRAFALLSKVRDRHDDNFQEVFSGWLGDVQDELSKASDVDTKREMLSVLKDAFVTDSLLKDYADALDSFMADYQKSFEEHIVGVNVDWDVAPNKAIDSVFDSVQTYFSGFASDQKARLTDALETGLAEGQPIREIASSIANGMDNVVYRDADGNVFRTLTPDQWATQVARTETQRAYITSTREALDSAGLETWQWLTAEDERTCDDCGENDEEIVAIGDDFPSGSTQPGDDHGNCRCTAIAVVSELTGDNASDDSSDESSADNSDQSTSE